MKNRIFFTIADEKNMPFAQALEKSFKHFHPDEEFVIFGGDDLKQALEMDPNFFYRATPVLAKMFMNKGYETIVKVDADSVITGDLSHVWEGEFDVAVVNNTSPRDLANAQSRGMNLTVWNIHPLSYVNCGFVAIKSKEFVDHWHWLCGSPHFDFYQYREQDLLNILVFYGNYHVKFLDAGDSFHGTASKGYWNRIELTGTKKSKQLLLRANEEWPNQNKKIKVIHWAGGYTPDKMKFDLYFQEDVTKWIKSLTS